MSTPTKEQIEQAVTKVLRERLYALDIKPGSKKALDAECHFLCGAMATLNFVFPNEDDDAISEMIPPAWIFGPLAGRSVLEKKGRP